MQKILGIIFLSFSITYKSFSLDFSLRTNTWNDFQGKLGPYEIQLSLFLFENGKIKGNYLYKKNEEKIQLFGHLKNSNVVLTEVIDKSENGFFNGRIFIDDPDRFEGVWENKARTNKLNFKLTLKSTSSSPYEFRYANSIYGTTVEVENFVKDMKNSILNNDRIWISKHICYPIKVNLNGNKKVINNKKTLLKYYDEIITDKFKEKIYKYYTTNLFNNWQGVMFGQGEIWINNTKNSNKKKYDYCIIAINN
ncbi:hypothetical protein [Oceanivirga salmonicida]|uniref:hypothetical protein n=1 Tax=Oceanivirga salmonicida TaxID=1769291 RepID=UPI0008363C5A|nr:hypothetical protein [Oceanivirga salmonicida]